MQPIKPASQHVNGQKAAELAPKRVAVSRRQSGRELAMDAIRLRVYLGVELQRAALECGLDPDHYSAAAVTALCISLERQGVRGIPEDCDVVVK